MKKKINVLIQYFLPQHSLSRFVGWISNRQWESFKNWQIKYFIKRYKVDINLALAEDITQYPTFNSFFTRELKGHVRPFPESNLAIISPADGCISQLGPIDSHQLFQAKGFKYTLQSLLASDQWATKFKNGFFSTIYLSPKDYHRVHMPLAGQLVETIFIPGKLFSVNPNTVSAVPNLFARNERLVCLFETAIGPVAVIFVGAMLVGSIHTSWNKQTIKSKKIIRTDYRGQHVEFDRGQELGYFNMGSTIILLFGEKSIAFSSTLKETATLCMGQEIAKRICP